MLSRTRNFFRGLLLNGRKVAELLREHDALRTEMTDIRREWEDELSEMRNMWDKLQLWATRQAKRDKAMAKEVVDELAVGPEPKGTSLFPAQMSKAELRRYAAQKKRDVPGVHPIGREAE